MFRIHREGKYSLLIAGLLLVLLLIFTYLYLNTYFLYIWIISILLYIFLINFFRNPKRKIPEKYVDDSYIMAPADGKVVAIEKVVDDEFREGEWIQLSIFMSPLNVHTNRHPVSGIIENYAYHPGKYHVAWHPKSSTENERTTLLYNSHETYIKVRQIAGAVARRIICYPGEGDSVIKGGELGFIKFGSRVDILLPTDAEVKVSINDKVKGNLDCIAQF